MRCHDVALQRLTQERSDTHAARAHTTALNSCVECTRRGVEAVERFVTVTVTVIDER